ncbi:MAG TPA: hypothetical protein DIU07_12030 [Rhodobacteraceae bacterium]|nr:hypothetical protein [Paracoccaceae bacterium]
MAADNGINTPALTVHLGVQKTASTAFHHLLHRNQGRLAERLTLRTPAPNSPTRAAARAAIAFSLAPNAANRAALANRIGALRDELLATGDTPILVSHENLAGAMPGNGGEVRLYPEIGVILKLLAEHLAPFTPRFVFYTRDMRTWKSSVYNQAVKTDGYGGTRAQFEAETAGIGSWDEMRARVVAAVGADNAAFFRLEDEPDPMRPGQQLLAHAGLSFAEIAALDPLTWRANQSLNPGALEFMRQINRVGLAPKPRTKVMQLVTQNQALFAPSLAEAPDAPGDPR